MENRKLAAAKIELLLKSPFLGVLTVGLRFEETNRPDIDTAATDGVNIFLNPAFIASLSKPELTGLIAHEVLHVAFWHPLRRGNRDPLLWNIAADYAINIVLKDAGFVLPAGALIDEKYRNWATEAIYADLLKQGKGKQQQQIAAAGFGKVMDGPASMGKEELEERTKKLVARAEQASRMQGTEPEGIKRLIGTATVRTNWREQLPLFLTEAVKTDYTFSRPNPRYMQTGFMLPSLHQEQPKDVLVFVDTSGSIDNDILNKFGAEIEAVTGQLGAAVEVVYVDAAVHNRERFEAGETIAMHPQGGGGTDFKPAFKWLEKEGTEKYGGVIYLTDGCCGSFPRHAPADLNVLWAVYDNPNFKPPFGHKIYIDD